jgi:hypothetical protein
MGAGVEFEIACRFTDQDGLELLRSLQRKIASRRRTALLFGDRRSATIAGDL